MRIISKKKIEELKIKMKEKKADVIILLNSAPIHDSSIEYITGFRQERNQAFACLVFSVKKSSLFVSSLDYDQACAEAEADEIIKIKKSGFARMLRESLSISGNVGICESIFPVSLCRALRKKTIGFGNEILNVRSVKEKKEIELIEMSCSVANKGIAFLEKNLKSFRTCREISIELERFLLKNGAEEIAFPTLVTSGKQGLYVDRKSVV